MNKQLRKKDEEEKTHVTIQMNKIIQFGDEKKMYQW